MMAAAARPAEQAGEAVDLQAVLAGWRADAELAESLAGMGELFEWVSLAEAEEAAGVSRSTLRAWYRGGHIPSRLVPGPYGVQRMVPLDVVIERAQRSPGVGRRGGGEDRGQTGGPPAEPPPTAATAATARKSERRAQPEDDMGTSLVHLAQMACEQAEARAEAAEARAAAAEARAAEAEAQLRQALQRAAAAEARLAT